MKSYEDIVLEIKKTWKKFIESLILFIVIFYLFVFRKSRNINIKVIKIFVIMLLLYFFMYIVEFAKLYIGKSILKKEMSDKDMEQIEEKFSISNYESYNKTKYKIKKNIIKYSIMFIALFVIFGIFYFSTVKDKEKYLKVYNSDKWYIEQAKLDHYDNPKKEGELSKGYFYYTGKDGKKYEYVEEVSSSDRETFDKTSEYKKQIYVSETNNSKALKYENYASKYDYINKSYKTLAYFIVLSFGISMIMLISKILLDKIYIK